MERELGNGLVNAFGARLRRTFEADASLPDPVAHALERLRQAERNAAAGGRPEPAQQPPPSDQKHHNGAFFSRFLPVGGT
ncbi:MAG: hypothetical protein AB7S70_06065 [Hyphomicrobium sp.]|uniref:hypothetical protein n=1 Tax=Hyphomicrobium sp. TaxID=82 RepID=UPI003D14CEC2